MRRRAWDKPSALILVGLVLAGVFVGAFLILSPPWKARPDVSRRGSNLQRREEWSAFGGDWTVNDAGVQNSSEERGAKLISRFDSRQDYAVEADLQIQEDYGEAGLIIRSHGEEDGVDAYHGYFAGVRTIDGTFEFGRADFGWRPLVQRAVPEGADVHGPLHLKVVAVGCRFAVAVTLPGHPTSSAVADDPDCLKQGNFGLRSNLTSATWTNLNVHRASADEFDRIAKQASLQRKSPAESSFLAAPAALDRLTASVRREARKHEVQPGVQPIQSFLLAPGRHPDVAIQGVVISTPPLTAIQDDSGALLVPSISLKTPLKLGDVVEARGTVVSERFRSRLEDARIRVLWSDMPVPPLAVTASQLTGGTYRGRAIEVEGVLRSSKVAPGRYDLVLQDGDQIFRALGFKDFQVRPGDLEPGSRVRIRGNATSLPQFTEGVYPFAVVAEGVQVISPAPWWSRRHIAWVVLLCMSVLLLWQLLLHRLQQWRLQTILHEREQLAFEMHDTLAQSFTGISYQLQAASRQQHNAERTQTYLRNALEMVQASHREASHTIAALRPQHRDGAGILAELKATAERLSDGGDVQVSTTLTGRTGAFLIEVTDAFFRIGQEAVRNAIQHGRCRHLSISLRISKREAQLSIEDDGCGFAQAEIDRGLGVASMRQRASRIKGQLDIVSRPGQGTRLTVIAPLPLARSWMSALRAKLWGVEERPFAANPHL